MYSDPSLIREHVVKLSFNDREADLVNAWVAYTGQQKAAFLREIILARAEQELNALLAPDEAPQRTLFSNS